MDEGSSSSSSSGAQRGGGYSLLGCVELAGAWGCIGLGLMLAAVGGISIGGCLAVGMICAIRIGLIRRSRQAVD